MDAGRESFEEFKRKRSEVQTLEQKARKILQDLYHELDWLGDQESADEMDRLRQELADAVTAGLKRLEDHLAKSEDASIRGYLVAREKDGTLALHREGCRHQQQEGVPFILAAIPLQSTLTDKENRIPNAVLADFIRENYFNLATNELGARFHDDGAILEWADAAVYGCCFNWTPKKNS